MRIILAMAVMLVGCGASVSVDTTIDTTSTTQTTAATTTTTTAPSILQVAWDTCEGNGSNYGITFDEAGMFIDGKGDESNGASIDKIACLLTAMDVPDSVIARMDHTTSLMGVQEASWGNISASWSYHPNNGLDISIVESGDRHSWAMSE